MPREFVNDNDSKDFGASLALIVPVLLVICGVVAVVIGLLA